MFLHLLTEDSEQDFFLKFAYLLAVAEEEDDSANIPVHAYSDNPEKNEYEFGEFAPGFSMQTSELLMLRKFTEEMGMTWEPVSSYSSLEECFGAESALEAFQYIISLFSTVNPSTYKGFEYEHKEYIFRFLSDLMAKLAKINKVEDYDETSTPQEVFNGILSTLQEFSIMDEEERNKELHNLGTIFERKFTENYVASILQQFSFLNAFMESSVLGKKYKGLERVYILKFVLGSLIMYANADNFSIEKRKAILLEATAMVYADGDISEHEQELLAYFCDACRLDQELLEDFKNITKEFSKIYLKSLELITE